MSNPIIAIFYPKQGMVNIYRPVNMARSRYHFSIQIDGEKSYPLEEWANAISSELMPFFLEGKREPTGARESQVVVGALDEEDGAVGKL